MKLLFWNLNKKDNADLALTCMREEEVGIAAFAEFSHADFSDAKLEGIGCRTLGFGGCDKVKVIARESIEVLDCFEASRFTVLSMKSGNSIFVVGAAHLPDRMSSPDSESRLMDIRAMMGEVRGYENELSISKTIILGDLNANPYDKELLHPNAFNAMLFKGIVRNKSSRTWREVEYPFLYNPTIQWLSEESENYGSIYYSGDCTGPIWNCYDQALVSPELMDCINSYSYLKRIGDRDLIAKVRPNGKISDHLPLLVDIDLNQVS